MIQNTYNEEILEEARKDIGKKGGQCKVWCQAVIDRATGIWVPSNDPDTAKKYRWQPGGDPRILSTEVLSLYPPVVLTPGDCVQTLWDPNLWPHQYHWHTWFFLEYGTETITMLDSNWYIDTDKDGVIEDCEKEMVQIHKVKKAWFDKMSIRSTIYRIRK